MTDKARQLATLSREKLNKGWCQGHLTVDRNGNGCAANSHLAVAWSLEGSIIYASSYFARYDDWLNAVIEVWPRLEQLCQPTVSRWNDAEGRTQEEVVALMNSIRVRTAGVPAHSLRALAAVPLRLRQSLPWLR